MRGGGPEGMSNRATMRTKLRETMAHAMRAKRPLLVRLPSLALVALLTGCGQIPGIPVDGGFDVVTYRTRESIGAVARPNPPPVVAGLGGAAAAIPTLAAGAPAGVTQEMVEQGAQQFGTVCSACHGAGGAGTPAAPELNDNQWIHISGNFDEIVSIIKTGVSNPREYAGAMPPLGGGSFNEEQVRAIAAYVFALSHQ